MKKKLKQFCFLAIGALLLAGSASAGEEPSVVRVEQATHVVGVEAPEVAGVEVRRLFEGRLVDGARPGRDFVAGQGDRADSMFDVVRHGSLGARSFAERIGFDNAALLDSGLEPEERVVYFMRKDAQNFGGRYPVPSMNFR